MTPSFSQPSCGVFPFSNLWPLLDFAVELFAVHGLNQLILYPLADVLFHVVARLIVHHERFDRVLLTTYPPNTACRDKDALPIG